MVTFLSSFSSFQTPLGDELSQYVLNRILRIGTYMGGHDHSGLLLALAGNER